VLGENDGENWILIGPSVAICVRNLMMIVYSV